MIWSKFTKVRRKNVFFVILVAMASYYFIPFILFRFATVPAEMSDNNQSNIEILKKNKGGVFSFMVFGDNRADLFLDDAVTLKLISHMNKKDGFGIIPIDFSLNTGDITLSGKCSHFIAFKKERILIKYPLLVAYGNHENRVLFEEYLGKTEFVFCDRNSYFIVLDNSEDRLTDSQFEWFEKCLIEGQKYDHIFVSCA